MKINPAIIVRQRRTDRKQIGLLRAVRRIKEGTSAVLLQSGLDEKWWADSMECDCYLRNIQDLLSDGKILCEGRFCLMGRHLSRGDSETRSKDQLFHVVQCSNYHPISAKDLSRLHQFGKKVLPGIFLGYVFYTGRNRERRHFGRRH